MRIEWKIPAGEYPRLYCDMLEQKHILIGGATGSGKSVVINGIIHAALFHSPVKVQFIMIDLKRVELENYRRIPHTIAYADDVTTACNALQTALNMIESRYKIMQRNREKLFTGSDLYIVIDELADLMTTAGKVVTPLLQRICQIGRAAKVHVIAATQYIPIVSTAIRVNFDSRLGLRTSCKQDSRNILGVNGCEALPIYGYGYYKTPAGIELHKLPMTPETELNRIVTYWEKSKPKYKLFG